MMRIQSVIAVILLAQLAACASYTDDTRAIRSAFRGRNYQGALAEIESSVIKEQERNELLYLLEKAMILDRQGDLEGARGLLTRADRVVDRLYTLSISKEAASFVTNDSMTDYGGEDHEKVAIHTMLGLAFIEEKKWKAAEVEARRINTRLEEINSKYDKEAKNRYSEDAFARYFAGIIHFRNKNWDAAIVDYRKAVSIYEGAYTSLFGLEVPDSLLADLHRLYLLRGRRSDAAALMKKYEGQIRRGQRSLAQDFQKQAEVIVFHELGQATPKETDEFVFSLSSQIVRMSFPKIPQRGRYPGTTGIKIGGEFVQAELLQDIDEVARVTLVDRRGRRVLKQGARLLVKGQLAEQARQNAGPLAELAVNLVNVATETADTRSWTLLPRLFMVTRKTVAPGRHTVEIKNQSRIAELIPLELSAGEVVILRSKD